VSLAKLQAVFGPPVFVKALIEPPPTPSATSGSVIPAKAGIHDGCNAVWIPGLRSASPGMTNYKQEDSLTFPVKVKNKSVPSLLIGPRKNNRKRGQENIGFVRIR